MSLPSFPDKDKMPTREEAINQIISSIAMEELGLSHIINAEGEKLQYALGTLEGSTGPEAPLTVDELLKLNESVHNTLNSNMMNQFFLKEKLTKALSASVMAGPSGPEGPAGPMGPVGAEGPQGPAGLGIEILNSYATLAELVAAHPEGKPGDVYAVGGVLYYWNEDANPPTWSEIKNLNGPEGPEGPAGEGLNILGVYADDEARDLAQPNPQEGDTVVTAGVLEIYDGTEWVPVENLKGPAGPEGPAGLGIQILGSFGTLAELIAAHATGAPGDVYAVDGVLHYWNKDATPPTWSPIANLHGPTGPAGAGIGLIPFTTGRDSKALDINAEGQASNIMIAGSSGRSDAISITTTGFTMPTGDGFFLAYTLAHDITVKRICATIANWEAFTPPSGSSIYPFIILATASWDSNNFTFLGSTKTKLTTPWRGGSRIPAGSNLFVETGDIGVTIPAGSRLAICCGFDMTGGRPFFYYFYFSGSIYYE